MKRIFSDTIWQQFPVPENPNSDEIKPRLYFMTPSYTDGILPPVVIKRRSLSKRAEDLSQIDIIFDIYP